MYKILEAGKLAGNIYKMVVEAPRVAKHCLPGQFVIVKMDEVGERIPLTICDYDREAGTITIVFQPIGASTEKFSMLQAGDSFRDFVGPLGQPSDLCTEPLEEVKKKKTYRNFTRSEKAIVHAYVELMQKNKKITVTDIVNTADLNRSTFYAHFKTADDVREKIQTDVINELFGSINKNAIKSVLEDPYDIMNHVREFIEGDEEMYKMLLNTDGADKFLKRLRDIVIEKCMRDASEASYISDKESFEMNLRLFIGGYVSVIEDWAAGSIGMSLKKCTEIMSESIKICIQKYVKR